ncbi:hypothetical protein [Candidatus Cyanaurora vandensis]|uniref:hypothetical protein n=1 Tax=Candidatus Cyanaurora vandensis TaxID=2714958 RepID=UPI00257CEF91|nr:hypothetical protein [Candidatus Cyanaurora vandensis]
MKHWFLLLTLGTPVLAQGYEYVRPSPLPPPPPTLNTMPPDTAPQVVPPPTTVKPPQTVRTTPAPQPIKPIQPAETPWQPKLLRQDVGIVLLPIGAKMPVKVYQSTLFAAHAEFPLVLEVAEDVMGVQGERVIPRGSRVQGTFKPITREIKARQRSSYKINTRTVVLGNYFVAEKVTIGAQTYELNAVSPPLSTEPDPRVVGDDGALKGSAYGVAGGVALGIVTGGLALPLLLAGGAMGAVTGGAPPETIALEPDRLLTLTLQAPLRGQPRT